MLPWWWVGVGGWGQKQSRNKVVKVCCGSERDEGGMNDLECRDGGKWLDYGCNWHLDN